MSQVTEHYVVAFRPTNPLAVPVIHLGDQANASYFIQSHDFDTYLINQVLPCYHGETDKTIIKYMVSATHEGWSEYRRIFSYRIKTNLPAPKPDLTYDPDGNPTPSTGPSDMKHAKEKPESLDESSSKKQARRRRPGM